MAKRSPGPLVIIGGAEDKTGDQVILREFVRCAGGGRARVAVVTVATRMPEQVGAHYVEVFHGLGVEHVQAVDIRSREAAHAPEVLAALGAATGIFFTGGDQLRIISLLGGTAADRCLHERHAAGVVLAGTSAGASAMSTIMIIEGRSEEHPDLTLIEKGPGLDFMSGVMIDQHFAQRGRLGRLLTAVAQHPGYLGIGIDENTAIVVHDDRFQVIGDGAVTIIDASEMSFTNLRALEQERHLALLGVKLHSLPAGYGFDLQQRQPLVPEGEGSLPTGDEESSPHAGS